MPSKATFEKYKKKLSFIDEATLRAKISDLEEKFIRVTGNSTVWTPPQNS